MGIWQACGNCGLGLFLPVQEFTGQPPLKLLLARDEQVPRIPDCLQTFGVKFVRKFVLPTLLHEHARQWHTTKIM
jgi:hypothetical protein